MLSKRDVDDLVLRLAGLRVTFGRPAETHSLTLNEGSGEVLAVFTSAEAMAAWWRARSNESLETRSMGFREMVTAWRSAAVDILLNPGSEAQIRIPIIDARRVLGLPALTGHGLEPLPYLVEATGMPPFTRKVVIPVSMAILIIGGLVTGVYLFTIIGGVMLVSAVWGFLRRRVTAFREGNPGPARRG